MASTTAPDRITALSHRQFRRRAFAGAVWTAAAGVALLLSLAGPLTVAVTTSGKVSLVALHLSVAAVLIPLLRRTAPPR